MSWPALPFEAWRATCDTLHAHTQVLGKLAVVLAPPEPQLQHAALRLSARGWETLPLPAPDGSGRSWSRSTCAATKRSSSTATGVSTRPAGARPAGRRGHARGARGGAIPRRPRRDRPLPQETPWTTPLDEDTEHATYDPGQVADVLRRGHAGCAGARGPAGSVSRPLDAGECLVGIVRPRVSLFSGRPAEPSSQDSIMRNAMNAQQTRSAGGPATRRYPRAAFCAYASPPPEGSRRERSRPRALAGVRHSAGTSSTGTTFGPAKTHKDPRSLRSLGGCARLPACDWDANLAASIEGDPPPVT